MNYKWSLSFRMKNGERYQGFYIGKETNSDAVARIILKGNENTFTGCKGPNCDSNLLVRIGEIVALDIKPIGVVE